MKFNVIVTFLATLLASSQCVSQEADKEARQIVDKAIAAYGGMERARQFDKCRTVYTGKVYVEEKPIQFEREEWTDGPAKYKGTLRMTLSGKKRVLIEVFTDQSGWRKFDDDLLDTSEEDLKARNESIKVEPLQALCELLESADAKIVRLESEKSAGRVAHGVRISKKGKTDVDLFIDSESFLPVKAFTIPKHGRQMGKKVEMRYDGFKDINKAKYASKTTVFVNGKKFMEAEITHIEILKSIDASIFAKPDMVRSRVETSIPVEPVTEYTHGHRNRHQKIRRSLHRHARKAVARLWAR